MRSHAASGEETANGVIGVEEGGWRIDLPEGSSETALYPRPGSAIL